jgi:hypothetical protein
MHMAHCMENLESICSMSHLQQLGGFQHTAIKVTTTSLTLVKPFCREVHPSSL